MLLCRLTKTGFPFFRFSITASFEKTVFEQYKPYLLSWSFNWDNSVFPLVIIPSLFTSTGFLLTPNPVSIVATLVIPQASVPYVPVQYGVFPQTSLYPCA